MIKSKLFSQAIVTVLVAGFILATAPAVLSQYKIFAGYGYGYGACDDAPASLTVRYLSGNNKDKISLRWNELEDSCDGIDYYQIQLRRSNGNLVEWWNTENTRKRISLNTLDKNRGYIWRVRAVFTNGETTEWSLYDTFRTKPNQPTNIRLSNIRTTSVKVSGRNVVRSNVLKRYQILLKQGNKVIRNKSIKKRLKRPRYSFNFRKLQPGTQYTIKMRSVYSTSLKSSWAVERFSTLGE